VSQQFVGQSRLERQRAVMQRVADLMPHPLHALAVKAYAPEEFIPS
jgi:stress-induced morphogen